MSIEQRTEVQRAGGVVRGMWSPAENPLTQKRWLEYSLPIELLPEYDLRDVSAAEAAGRGFSNPSHGIYITYPVDADSRIRYYHEGFRAQVEEQAKYGQRPHTPPAAYYPPTLSPGWEANANIPIMLTEGEFKAIVVDVFANRQPGQTEESVIPIGLGGVFNWQSKKLGVTLLPKLQEVKWLGRDVYIAFDSDLGTNAFVSLALNRLFNALMERGAKCWVLSWSQDKGKGIDDYLTSMPSGLLAWQQLIVTKQLPMHVLMVAELNKRFTYVEREQKVWDQTNGSYINIKSFANEFFTEKVSVQTGVKNTARGSVPVLKDFTVGAYWLQSPARQAVTALQFLPGEELFFSVEQMPGFAPTRYMNTWRGWGADLNGRTIQPERGDVQPFVDFLYATFGSESSEHVDYLLKRLAWMFQQPQNKHHTWIYLLGAPRQGKSTLIKLIASIVGQQCTSNIDDRALSGSFSEWRAEKLLVTLDDTEIANKQQVKQLLKRLTTEDFGRVNKKYQNEYTAANYFSFIYAANSVEPLLEHDDRRALVLTADCKWDFAKGEWSTFDNWLKQPNSRAALLHYLLYDVKLSADFFTQDPPKTQARELVVESSGTAWDEFLYNIASNFDKTVVWNSPAGGQVRSMRLTVFTADMMRALFNMISPYTEKFDIKNGVLGVKLSRYGAVRVVPKGTNDNRSRVTIGAQQVSFWTWDTNWQRSGPKELANEYMRIVSQFPELAPTRSKY